MNEKGLTPSNDVAPPRPRVTVAQINAEVQQQIVADRPRRRAAIAGVRNAVLATQSTRRQQQEAEAERAILRAEEQEAREAAIAARLQAEAAAQAEHIPTTVDEWNAHIASGVAGAIHYFHSRVMVEGGDRFALAEFFRGAQVFDPFFAASVDYNVGLELIEKMRGYHILNQGDDTIIDKLKRGWRAYRVNANRVAKAFDYSKDKAAILSWHYQHFLRLDEENTVDLRRGECRYCACKGRNCRCNGNLRVWWEAAQLAALVMPSSGAAERVFSLVNNLFNDQQSKALTDAIFLSLFLAYNKR